MRRILLIDDDAPLAAPLATFFARFNVALASALTPSSGRALLRAHAYDAAILDVMLPEMNGFELCRTIRRESDIPIIMLTARGDVMDIVVGLEIGADDCLPKPFEPRELLARLRTVLRRARPPAQAPKQLMFEGLQIAWRGARCAARARARREADEHRVQPARAARERATQGVPLRRDPEPAARP